jgi:uncharacterized phage protein (TIGR01671 family)
MLLSIEVMDNSRYKFRAWFPLIKVMDGNTMRSGVMGLVTNLKGSNEGYLFDGVVAECLIDGKQVFYEAYKNFTLMQYTGLKDKNGKEIYEGDLLRCVFDDEDEDNTPSEVVFARGAFFIGYEPNMICLTVGECEADELEVIGNIYENPELLTQPTTV